jgi:hypothetical protein
MCERAHWTCVQERFAFIHVYICFMCVCVYASMCVCVFESVCVCLWECVCVWKHIITVRLPVWRGQGRTSPQPAGAAGPNEGGTCVGWIWYLAPVIYCLNVRARRLSVPSRKHTSLFCLDVSTARPQYYSICHSLPTRNFQHEHEVVAAQEILYCPHSFQFRFTSTRSNTQHSGWA